MKRKILTLLLSVIFILTTCSGCAQNKINDNNVKGSANRYYEDANIAEQPNNLNEDKMKLVILKKHMLHKTIPCRGVKRGFGISRHL